MSCVGLVPVFGCLVVRFGGEEGMVFFLSNSEAPEKEVCQERCDQEKLFGVAALAFYSMTTLLTPRVQTFT